MILSKKNIIKIIKFYIVWWIAFIWNTLIVFYLYDTLHLVYYRSVIIMLIYSIPIFFLQKYLTFQNKTWKTIKQLYWFILLVIFFQLCWFYCIPYFSKLVWSYTVSMIIFTLLFTIISFCFQQFILFVNHKNVWIKNP